MTNVNSDIEEVGYLLGFIPIEENFLRCEPLRCSDSLYSFRTCDQGYIFYVSV